MNRMKCHATREERRVVMGKEVGGEGSDSSAEGSIEIIDEAEERKLLGTEEEEVKERKYIHQPDPEEETSEVLKEKKLLGTEEEEVKERKYIHRPDQEEETVEALKEKIRELNKTIEKQKRRRLNGKRNLWVRVTNKKRYVKDEGRRETGREKAKRRVEEDKERRTREKRKK